MIPFLIFCAVLGATLLLLRLILFRGAIGAEVIEPPKGIIEIHAPLSPAPIPAV